MNEVALIACCKSKKETNEYTPADELYTGHLFQAQLAYARQVLKLPDSSIFVLSAYYGLVEIKRAILPYEMSLKDKLPVHRKTWAGRIELSLWNRTLDPETIYMMAGKMYRTAVAKRLYQMGRWPAEIVVPHPPGYGYGQQVAWYKNAIKEHERRVIQECSHINAFDASNEVVESGFVCQDCSGFFEHDPRPNQTAVTPKADQEIRDKWTEIVKRKRNPGCIIDSGAFAIELIRWCEGHTEEETNE